MAKPDPSWLSEPIARFMQLSQEQALDRKISSFQETINLLQERYNQEIKALQGITASQQEETTATRVAITNLQDRSDKHDERDEEISLLQDTVESLRTLAQKVEADNTKLQHEVVELRAQLSHAEDSLMKAEASRIRHQKERSHHPHEPRKTGPPQRQPQPNQPFEDINEERVLSHISAYANSQSPTPAVEGHECAQQQDRPLGQPYPRGVKRAHVDDAAEPPPWRTPAPEANNTPASGQPRRFTIPTHRYDHKLSHDCEAPPREEKRHSGVEDRAAARQKEFVDYVKSMCNEYNADNYGGSQRAFISRFIDGIKDPGLSRWFQESLKARFPDKVRDVPQSSRKAGGSIITPTRDLTWKDIEFLLPRTPWPSMTD